MPSLVELLDQAWSRAQLTARLDTLRVRPDLAPATRSSGLGLVLDGPV